MTALNEGQKAAAHDFCSFLLNPNEPVMVITGAPGTGKTTLVKHLLDNLPAQTKVMKAIGVDTAICSNVLITSTTRKAVEVLQATLGYGKYEVTTIHSALGFVLKNDYVAGGSFLERRNNAKTVESALIIIDEASYIEQDFFDAILQCTKNCKFLFIGDPNQLMPVNGNCPIFTGKFPTSELTEVMRFNGSLTTLASQFRRSVTHKEFKPIVPDNNKVFLLDGSNFKNEIDKSFNIKDYQPGKSIIVAWTNARVAEYNNYVSTMRGQKTRLVVGNSYILNDPLIYAGKDLAIPGDSLVTLTAIQPNIYEKGVLGDMVSLNHDHVVFCPHNLSDVKTLLTSLKHKKDWSTFYHIKETWVDLRPPFSCTTHKCQGSTYKEVFIDLSDIGRCNDLDVLARLLYVASTRASERVVFYGELPESLTTQVAPLLKVASC